MVRTKHTSVSLPVSLLRLWEKKLDGTGFRSLSEFVIFLLRELAPLEFKTITRKEKEKIIEKLRDLGYM